MYTMQQLHQELAEEAEWRPQLKRAIFVSRKRDATAQSIAPLLDWLYAKLLVERDWRLRAEKDLEKYDGLKPGP